MQRRLDSGSIAAAARAALAQSAGEIRLGGLREQVEVLRDTWGVPHVYAQNQYDLFFAQGFVQAQDRLFQMEVWRREAEGRLSEIAGPEYVERDTIARLIRYRGGIGIEWSSYGPNTREIVEAFVAGVNAYMEVCADNPPIEFQLLDIKPEPWTPEVCLGRMAGFIMCRNASTEVMRALLLRELGAAETERLLPMSPPLALAPFADQDFAGIDERLLSVLSSLGLPVRIPLDLDDAGPRPSAAAESVDGSNDWVISGRRTATGLPLLANDPHRSITLPSLRYIIHLACPGTDGLPGWNVIGGSEPAVPGVTIGHNEDVAWGITIVNTDQQDLFLEELHPEIGDLYRVGDSWVPFRVEQETLLVKGESEPRHLTLKFTRHGPVIHEDMEKRRAVALAWAGCEAGGAGYLASLALDTARDRHDVLAATERWRVPSSNVVYADRAGHIGWIAAAATPVREGWEGVLPVEGWQAEREWSAWLPASALPQKLDPPEGYIATANSDILPPGYRHTITHDWSAPYRFERIDEVLGAADKVTAEDCRSLQQDVTSLPARRLLARLRAISSAEGALREVAEMLLSWDCVLDKESREAALFEVWLSRLIDLIVRPRVPERLWRIYSIRQPVETLLDLVENPDARFGADPRASCDKLLLNALSEAIHELEKLLGSDGRSWGWGRLHRAHFRHTLATSDPPEDVKNLFDLDSVSRGGDGNTPLATAGPGFDQVHGASYAHVLDLSNWDNSIATNTPGQSGQPGSGNYGNLRESWANGSYFPLAYTRKAVEVVTDQRLLLQPERSSERSEMTL